MKRLLPPGLEAKASWWFSGLLIAITLAIYAPAIRFGLIWDDPRFYQAAAAISPWWKAFLVPSIGTRQYYRPLAMIYSQWLIGPAGTVYSPLAHVVHIGVHLAILLSLVPLLRALRFNLAHARLTALCFALFPPSFFTVTWHTTPHPVMVLFVIWSIVAARQYTQRRQGRYLVLSLAVYSAALLVMEAAVPFVAIFFWLAWDTDANPFGLSLRQLRLAQVRSWLAASAWALLHLAVTGLYLLIWLIMPLNRSVTGQGFSMSVLTYIFQAMVFPVGQAGVAALAPLPEDWLILVYISVWAALTLVVWKWQSLRIAVLANLLTAVGAGPIWAGLAWDYARYGARLFYPAAFGIAMAWAGGMALAFRKHWATRLAGIAIGVAVVGSSVWQMQQFQRLYQVSTTQLNRAIDVLSAAPVSSRPILFVNFPDQLELRPRLYPVGYWGLVLAPVIQNLSDYAQAIAGHSAADLSLSSSSSGADARASWPYRVDMRGIDTSPPAFFEAARQAELVYLTDYLPDGTLSLVEAGAIRPSAADGPYLARLGDHVQLVRAEISPGGELRLTWRCLQVPPPGDTIFVHFWRGGEFVGNADGDSLGGLVPVFTWQAGAEILDVRSIAPALAEPGVYEVRVGLYNRDSGARYPAIAADGQPFGDGEIPVGVFHK